MKTIENKQGNKTTYKIVADDYVEQPDKLNQKDLTTSGCKCLGYSDISADDWNRIFKKKMAGKLRKIAETVLGILPEYRTLEDAKKEMDKANLIGGDNYYHRLGMCRAVQLKNPLWPSDKIAKGLGYLKEANDIYEKTDWEDLNGNAFDISLSFIPSLYTALLDSKKDLENNTDGQRLACKIRK